MTKNILLVDDEPDITFTLKDILEDNGGFKVDTFTDPTIALKSYKINFYDIIILDIKMPKMDGFELYIKIR
jgi:DNA-binding response OmpR family regulator